MIGLDVALRLGRVSNLPTVWSNTLAGAVLAGAALDLRLVWAALALSAFYIAGMWLNDAFDAEADKTLAPTRPIPAGEISRRAVFAGGFGFLALGLLLAMLLGAGWAGGTLAAVILLYDITHKKTALAPVIMGLTRLMCYLLAAMALAGAIGAEVLWPAVGLFAYVVGLTYGARMEAFDRIGAAWPFAVLSLPVVVAGIAALSGALSLLLFAGFLAALGLALYRLRRRQPGDVKRAVVLMIAAISLYDAVLVAGSGQAVLALVCAAFFGLTLWLQRVASGT
ncbi:MULTISPECIES: UbiA family prenyltransferase [unclassified Marinovum]